MKENNNNNSDDSQDIHQHLQEIHAQLDKLNSHAFVRAYNSKRRMLGFQFLRGVAFGLGSVIGATIVVSIVVSALAQIEFVPIIGEWARQIIEEVEP